MIKSRKLVAVAAAAAALAAGGSAFTASIDTTADATDVVGAGAVSVSGGTVLSVDYVNDTENITGVTVVFDGKYAADDTDVTLEVGGQAFTQQTEDDTADYTVTFTGTAPISSATGTTIAINSDTEPTAVD